MHIREASEEFSRCYGEIYMRFYRRIPVGDYVPTPETLAVLRHLSTTGPLTVTEAARHFERSQAAMSEILDRMQARELVERYRDERDRRRVLVWLTPRGQAALRDHLHPLSVEALAGALARLDAAERDALLRGMRALLRSASQPEEKP